MNDLICPVPLVEDLIPFGRNNRPGSLMVPRYITIHDTGNSSTGADARAHASYLKGDTAANLPVSWHFTVDDRGAYQHLPISEHGWHAGDGHGPGNMESIAIEICENADGKRLQAETNAASLTAYLLLSLGLNLSAVVPHKQWSGKECPHLLLTRWEEWLGEVNDFKPIHGSGSWDPVLEIGLLMRDGLINSEHDPSQPVTWAEFATVLNRLRHVSHQ